MIAVCWLVACAASCSPSGELAAHPYKSSEQPPSGPFLVKPYLQPGDAPGLVAGGTVQVLWHTEDADAQWAVECRTGADKPWQPTPAPTVRRIAVEGVSPHRLYRTSLAGLEPGGEFSYRVRKGGEIVFAADGRGPRPAGKPQRFVVFGDCGANTAEQRTIAFRAYEARPDFVMITGDIVYDRGRVSEYREKFWPIYNADEASPSQGAPLLRSTLFLAAPGNHDIATRDLGKYPDGLAYFLYWAQPLNGPAGEEGGAHVPRLGGPEENKKAFLEAAGPQLSRGWRTSRSTTATPTGRSWTRTRTWTGPIASCGRGSSATWPPPRSATWRFVALHQPGFNSARKHFDEQNMRVLADVFEAGGVDLVFCGHVHNYQRRYPLRFVVERGRDGKPIRSKELVNGRWTLDASFDGQTKTRARGRHLPRHRRRGGEPVQSRAAGRPRLVARVHLQARLQGPLADRRRRGRIEADGPPGLAPRAGARSLRRDEMSLISHRRRHVASSGEFMKRALLVIDVQNEYFTGALPDHPPGGPSRARSCGRWTPRRSRGCPSWSSSTPSPHPTSRSSGEGPTAGSCTPRSPPVRDSHWIEKDAARQLHRHRPGRVAPRPRDRHGLGLRLHDPHVLRHDRTAGRAPGLPRRVPERRDRDAAGEELGRRGDRRGAAPVDPLRQQMMISEVIESEEWMRRI